MIYRGTLSVNNLYNLKNKNGQGLNRNIMIKLKKIEAKFVCKAI